MNLLRWLAVACAVVSVAGDACAQAADDFTPEGLPPIAALRKGAGCAPRDNTARVLKSAHPNDLVANWSGKNWIGTAWTFAPKRYVKTDIDGGIFLQGDLLSTRGGVTDRNVFVLFKEWDCAGAKGQ